MKKTHKLIRICFLCLLIVGFSLAQANALSIGDSYFVGLINDGIPSNPASEVVYINTLIGVASGTSQTIGTEYYDRSLSSLDGLPEVTGAGAAKDDTVPLVFDGTGFEYILGKYDAFSAGSLVWYNPAGFGPNMQLELPTHFTDAGQYGLSHISGYNAVPVPAAIYLLGAGFVGLAGLRKKFKK